MSFELRVLVTGFVPFRGDPYNPSGVTADWLHGRRVSAAGRPQAGAIIGRGDIPVRFVNQGNGGAQVIEDLILDVRPDIVINLGMARQIFEVEQEARDLEQDPLIRPDQAGYSPIYRTTLPVHEIMRAIQSEGGEVSASSDAGKYVCEDVFYHVMRLASTSPGDLRILRAGFIHVPKYVVLDDSTIPNALAPGVKPVPQTLINNAIYRAVEATVADVTEDEYALSRER